MYQPTEFDRPLHLAVRGHPSKRRQRHKHQHAHEHHAVGGDHPASSNTHPAYGTVHHRGPQTA